MTPGRVLQELVALAGRLGVVVRSEPFGKGVLEGRGGLCWVKGAPLVVMDEGLGVADRVAVLARALSCFDLEAVQMMPLVRETIEAAKGGAPMRRGKRARPGLARAKRRE